MAPPKSDVPEPPVQRQSDIPSTSTTPPDISSKLLEEANEPFSYDRAISTSYGAADWGSPSMAEFGRFTLSGDVTGNSMSPEGQATVNDSIRVLTQSIARDAAAVETLVQSTEAAAISGNYDQLAQNMADAYARLKDDPAAFLAFRDSLQNELKDNHMTVDGAAENGVVSLRLHREGTDTGLEIVAAEGADGKPTVTGRGYESQTKEYLSGSPEASARDLVDPVVEAMQEMEFSKNMPELKAMDTDGNGRVNLTELRSFEASTPEQQAAKEYFINHFNAIAETTGTNRIDMSNTTALAKFPQLQDALTVTQNQLGDRPMTEANIKEAKRELNRAIQSSLLPHSVATGRQRQLDQVLQNFDSLRIATAPPGDLGFSSHDSDIFAARAAVRALSESVLSSFKDGATPKPPVELATIINATNNPEAMAKLLPAIISATNQSILSTPYRYETKRTTGTDSTGALTETMRLEVFNASPGTVYSR